MQPASSGRTEFEQRNHAQMLTCASATKLRRASDNYTGLLGWRNRWLWLPLRYERDSTSGVLRSLALSNLSYSIRPNDVERPVRGLPADGRLTNQTENVRIEAYSRS